MSASLSADVAHSRGLWTAQTVGMMMMMMMQVDRYLHAPFVLTLQLPTSRRRGLRQSLGSFTLADERVEGLHSSEDFGVIFYIHCHRSLCSSGTDADIIIIAWIYIEASEAPKALSIGRSYYSFALVAVL